MYKRQGSEVDAGKNVQDALSRYKEGLDLLCQYVIDKGYNLKFAIEPKPNEPRGDILLREKAKAFRADPRVQAALEASRVGGTAVPTLAPGETYDDLVADVDANFDVEAAAARGYHYVQLDQLAVEHLLGTA